MVMNILLAEDDKISARNKKRARGRRFQIDLVHDGVEAVLRFIDKSYQFILIDIRMPNLGRINALRIIKNSIPMYRDSLFRTRRVSSDRRVTQEGAIKCFIKPLL
jgi:CheY-like chemotaxis protein